MPILKLGNSRDCYWKRNKEKEGSLSLWGDRVGLIGSGRPVGINPQFSGPQLSEHTGKEV